MIKLIVGEKGSGKTKILINMINETAKVSKGDVVCIEKGAFLTYNIDHSVRLVNFDEYGINGCDEFYSFIAGLLAANYDCTDIYIDSTLKITGRDYEKVGKMFDRLDKISSGVNIIMTFSADPADLPESVVKYIK